MSEITTNKEIQSRREFFKNAAKSVLPILGAVALLNTPIYAITTGTRIIPTGCDYCEGTCHNGCKDSCDGCEGCRGGCEGCSGYCENSCSGSCTNGCKSTCDSSCYGWAK